MVTRIIKIVVFTAVFVAMINPDVSNAGYCAPTGCPPKVTYAAPFPGPGPMPGMGMPGPVMGPAPSGCVPSCPPPCPPPACGPSMSSGFNPLTALFSVVALPFKLIGSCFASQQDCMPPMCPPPGCMPMCGPPPNCGPQPIVKCKPPRNAMLGHGPMGY